MAIQMLAAWNGYEQHAVYTLSNAEETRLIALGLARSYSGGAVQKSVRADAVVFTDGTLGYRDDSAGGTGSTVSAGGVDAVFVPKVQTFGGVMDAVALAQEAIAAGKTACVQFQPELYDIAAAGQGFPILSGLRYEGAGFGLSYLGFPNCGTVISGAKGFDIFSGNSVDRSDPLTDKNTFIAERINSIAIRRIAMKNCRSGVSAGAKYRSGAFYSLLEDLHVSNHAGFGISCENWGYSDIRGITCIPDGSYGSGSGFIGASGTNNYNHGNMQISHLYSQDGGYLTRGWVFMARGETGYSVLNDINLFKLQRNTGGPANGIRVAATMANGSANITVPDASAFPVDMPVTFTSTANGFNIWQTYFVVSSAGTTLQLSDTMGGNPISATGNSAITLCCFGFPALEVIGRGTNYVQPSHFIGLDVEGNSTGLVILQNCSANVSIGTAFSGRGVNTASAVVARGAYGNLSSVATICTDLDGASATNLLCDLRLDVSVGRVGSNPVGLVKQSDGKLGLNLGGTSAQASAISLQPINASGLMHIYPDNPISQRVWTSSSTSLSMFGTHMGCGSYVGTANATWTLPTLSGSAGGAANTYLGATFELCNASTTAGAALTINTAAGQPFNRQAGKTSVVLQPGQSFTVRAQTNAGGDWFWQITGNNGVTI